MTAKTPIHDTETITAAFAVVLTYTVTDGFRVPVDARPALLTEMKTILDDAHNKSSTTAAHVPAAVITELQDHIYSHALAKNAVQRAPEQASLGTQGTLDDWAWLITDSIEKAYDLPSIHRIYFHARVTALLTEYAHGSSVYLPTAIRQRLATTNNTEEVTP